MSALVRAVAGVVRPAVRRWRAFWDVDHVAGDFRTEEEQEAWLEAARVHNARLERASMQSYARRHILPRIVFQGDSMLPTLTRPTSAAHGGL
jgi:hypothetical protein